VTQSFSGAVVLIGSLLAAAPEAVAQVAPVQPTRSLVPAAYPRWDAGGTVAVLTMSASETRSSWNDWMSQGERLDPA
jgi:hypothetical protein